MIMISASFILFFARPKKSMQKKGRPAAWPSASLAGTVFSARAETRLFFFADALSLVCSNSLPAFSEKIAPARLRCKGLGTCFCAVVLAG
ncbi:MAG: hypothetical protein SWH68_09510 [Thermodesulfobacteriota bacterium]|nr:hypothetical protein [Thermodesulfobacteriota bacterium]